MGHSVWEPQVGTVRCIPWGACQLLSSADKSEFVRGGFLACLHPICRNSRRHNGRTRRWKGSGNDAAAVRH
jgi:hypothetical protein